MVDYVTLAQCHVTVTLSALLVSHYIILSVFHNTELVEVALIFVHENIIILSNKLLIIYYCAKTSCA